MNETSESREVPLHPDGCRRHRSGAGHGVDAGVTGPRVDDTGARIGPPAPRPADRARAFGTRRALSGAWPSPGRARGEAGDRGRALTTIRSRAAPGIRSRGNGGLRFGGPRPLRCAPRTAGRDRTRRSRSLRLLRCDPPGSAAAGRRSVAARTGGLRGLRRRGCSFQPCRAGHRASVRRLRSPKPCRFPARSLPLPAPEPHLAPRAAGRADSGEASGRPARRTRGGGGQGPPPVLRPLRPLGLFSLVGRFPAGF